MSLSWRNRLQLGLCPDRVIAVRFAQNRVASRHVYPGDADLAGILASLEAKRAEATVVLSNHFVKYAVLPWSEALLSMGEQEALAGHRFAETYGECEWEIRVSEGGMGSPSLASAVERPFIERLKRAFEASGVRLKSVQPYLMAAFNACRSKLGEDSSWFAMAEKGLFCIAKIEKGQWQRVRLSRGGFEEAWLVLEREALLAGDAGRKVHLYAPEGGEPVQGASGWQVLPIRFETPAGIPAGEAENYAMALTCSH